MARLAVVLVMSATIARRGIRIPQPKVRPGDTVSVVNYRRRPAVWEPGKCKRAEFKIWQGSAPGAVGGAWQYTCTLDRLPATRLYVGDARVELES